MGIYTRGSGWGDEKLGWYCGASQHNVVLAGAGKEELITPSLYIYISLTLSLHGCASSFGATNPIRGHPVTSIVEYYAINCVIRNISLQLTADLGVFNGVVF